MASIVVKPGEEKTLTVAEGGNIIFQPTKDVDFNLDDGDDYINLPAGSIIRVDKNVKFRSNTVCKIVYFMN